MQATSSGRQVHRRHSAQASDARTVPLPIGAAMFHANSAHSRQYVPLPASLIAGSSDLALSVTRAAQPNVLMTNPTTPSSEVTPPITAGVPANLSVRRPAYDALNQPHAAQHSGYETVDWSSPSRPVYDAPHPEAMNRPRYEQAVWSATQSSRQ
jgi:hypothetical protein